MTPTLSQEALVKSRKQDVFALADQLVIAANSKDNNNAQLQEFTQELATKFDLYCDGEKNSTRLTETLFYLRAAFKTIQEQRDLTQEALEPLNKLDERISKEIYILEFISYLDTPMRTAFTEDFSTFQNITQNAYRTVDFRKTNTATHFDIFNIKPLCTDIIEKYRRHKSRVPFSFLTLQDDLRTFLNSKTQFLTNQQKIIIKETISLFEQAAETDHRIIEIQLLKLFLLNKIGKSIIYEELIFEKKINLVKEIQKAIGALEIGDTYLLPGGYEEAKSGGHFVLYQIKRVSEQKFQFTILNTGEGIETFHESANGRVHSLYVEDVTLESITNIEFIGRIVGFRVDCKEENILEVYSFIQRYFNTLKNGIESYWPQTWGTCSYSPLEVFLEHKLPQLLFLIFKYEIQLKARRELIELLPKADLAPNLVQLINAKSCEAAENQRREVNAICSDADYLLTTSLKIQEMQSVTDLRKELIFQIQRDFQESKSIQKLARCSFFTEIARPLFDLLVSFFTLEECLYNEDYEQSQVHKKEFENLLRIIARKSPKTADEIKTAGEEVRRKGLVGSEDLQATFEYLQRVERDQQELESLCASVSSTLSTTEKCPDAGCQLFPF